MDPKLNNLIEDFLHDGSALLAEMRETGRTISAHGMHSSETRPREGILPSGATFSLHGIGCRFERPDGTVVEVDLGPRDRLDGVDAWRLFEFAQSTHRKDFGRMEEVEGALKVATLNGELQKCDDPPWHHLFFPTRTK